MGERKAILLPVSREAIQQIGTFLDNFFDRSGSEILAEEIAEIIIKHSSVVSLPDELST